MKKVGILLFLMFGMGKACLADEAVLGRRVLDIGCHLVNGQCYATLDGPAFGSSYGCPSNQVRWDADANLGPGRRWYANFMIAYLQGKLVSLNIAGCSPLQPQWPTFIYGSLYG